MRGKQIMYKEGSQQHKPATSVMKMKNVMQSKKIKSYYIYDNKIAWTVFLTW